MDTFVSPEFPDTERFNQIYWMSQENFYPRLSADKGSILGYTSGTERPWIYIKICRASRPKYQNTS